MRAAPALFAASIPTNRLKALVDSAAAVAKDLTLRLDDASDTPIRIWAGGKGSIVAMEGQTKEAFFKGLGGDGETRTIALAAKLMQDAVKVFNQAEMVHLSLEEDKAEGKAPRVLYLVLRQETASEEEGQVDEGQQRFTVQEVVSEPVRPSLPKSAYAAVDLGRLKKAMDGLKKNSDVVAVDIGDSDVVVGLVTKKLQHGWRQSATTSGKAHSLFASDSLQKAVKGAAAVATYGEFHLANNEPIRIEAVSEDLHATFYVANREAMT